MLDHSLTLAIRADHNARAAGPDFLAQLERYYDVDSKARAEARRLLLSIYWRARVGPKHWTDDTPTNVQAWAHEQITAHHTAHGWRGEVVAARCVLVDGRRTKSRRRFMRMSKQTYCPNYCHFALRCPIDGRAYLLGYNHRGPDQ